MAYRAAWLACLLACMLTYAALHVLCITAQPAIEVAVVQCRRRWKNFQDAELKKTGVWSPKVHNSAFALATTL